MSRVLLTGRFTRDPEMRSLPSGKAFTNSVVAPISAAMPCSFWCAPSSSSRAAPRPRAMLAGRKR